MGFFKNLQGSTAAPRLQNQQFGEVERIERMPAPPRPMQPRPSLVVGGPAFFTPEGYQAPVQPEQAFMPTDRRPDPIGDNFRRPYERPIMPMPSPAPMPMPSPTPPPEMAQPAPPRVPIEQPKETLPVDPGPVRSMPMPMPVPEPQPKYDPYAPSEMGARIAAGEDAYRREGDRSSGYLMNIYWIDDKGKVKNTTEGWSRVPKEFRNKVYRTKEEAEEESENMRTYEDRGDVDTTPRRTPVTALAPAPVETGGMGSKFERMRVAGSLAAGAVPTQEDILRVYTPYLLGSKNPEYTFNNIRALEEAGYALEGATPTSDIKIVPNTFRGNSGSFVPKVPQPPAPVVPQPMPSMPSLPSVTLPTLPTLGSRPGLRRMPMMDDPRER